MLKPDNRTVIYRFCEGKDEGKLKSFANYVLTKVYVVFVNTGSWKSAHRLFNVLNARGIPLSNADLIKNCLFGQVGSQGGQADQLEEKWLELDKAGFQESDILLEVNGKAVPNDTAAVSALFNSSQPNGEITAVVLRKGKRENLKLSATF